MVGSSFSKGRDGLVIAIRNGAKKWHGIYQKMILSSNRANKWHGIYQHYVGNMAIAEMMQTVKVVIDGNRLVMEHAQEN